MTPDTVRKLEKNFQAHPVTVAGPVAEPEVLELERQVGFGLPQAYKDFVTRYGGGIVGLTAFTDYVPRRQ